MKDRKKSHPVVWIELERTDDAETNRYNAVLATQMLRKLGVTIGQFEWWSTEKTDTYVYIQEGGSFYELPEDGHFFNLEYLAS